MDDGIESIPNIPNYIFNFVENLRNIDELVINSSDKSGDLNTMRKWMHDMSSILIAFSTVVKADRDRYRPIKFENNNEFSDQNYSQLNRKIDSLGKYYRYHLKTYSSRLEEVQKVFAKNVELTKSLQLSMDQSSISLNQVLTANNILRDERDELEIKLASLYAFVLKSNTQPFNLGPEFKPKNVTKLENFTEKLTRVDIPKLPLFTSRSIERNNYVCSYCKTINAKTMIQKTDQNGFAEKDDPGTGSGNKKGKARSKKGKVELDSDGTKTSQSKVNSAKSSAKATGSKNTSSSKTTTAQSTKFASKQPRPSSHISYDPETVTRENLKNQYLSVFDKSVEDEEAPAANIADKQFRDWNRRKQIEQLMHSFDVSNGQTKSTESLTTDIGYDKGTGDTGEYLIHDKTKNEDALPHPPDKPWELSVDLSDDHVPEPKRIPIAVQRVDGKPVYGPELPPSML